MLTYSSGETDKYRIARKKGNLHIVPVGSTFGTALCGQNNLKGWDDSEGHESTTWVNCQKCLGRLEREMQ
jgi:hypothetical protein